MNKTLETIERFEKNTQEASYQVGFEDGFEAGKALHEGPCHKNAKLPQCTKCGNYIVGVQEDSICGECIG